MIVLQQSYDVTRLFATNTRINLHHQALWVTGFMWSNVDFPYSFKACHRVWQIHDLGVVVQINISHQTLGPHENRGAETRGHINLQVVVVRLQVEDCIDHALGELTVLAVGNLGTEINATEVLYLTVGVAINDVVDAPVQCTVVPHSGCYTRSECHGFVFLWF